MEQSGKVVIYIDIDQIKANRFQPRKTFSDNALSELAESIKAYGVLQPISVRECEDGMFELIAGERRLRASKIAEIGRIPALVVDIDDEASAALALIENLQREDLNFLEEAQGYRNLIDQYEFTQKALAAKIGKSQSAIANKLRILKLSDDVLNICLENDLTERHARALLRLPGKKDRLMAVEKIVKQDLTVKKSERLIADMLEAMDESDGKVDKQTIKALINYRIYLNTLKRACKEITDTGLNVDYKEVEKDDCIEVIVKLPKNR